MKSIRKPLSIILCILLLLHFDFQKVKAEDKTDALGIIGIATVITTVISTVTSWTSDIVRIFHSYIDASKHDSETKKYKGFREREEATELIKDVISGVSPIKVYGQDIAKEQCMEALAGCLENIYGSIAKRKQSADIRGNIIYMIGPSGVGKTTMAKALANAFLKHSDHTCYFTDSSCINNEQELGEQLFRTTTKVVNLKKTRNLWNLWGLINAEDTAYDARIPSHLLSHILRWDGSVVIIDEYDKMKQATRPPDASPDYEDRSADEILKAIASTGKYRVGSDEIDCSKTLFFITTNETKEQLYKNFGYDGSNGGGVQRLNIVEFEPLSYECCEKIIDDMIASIHDKLTDPQGDYRIKDIHFSNQVRQDMANYIYSDTIKQARSKFDLEQKIDRLFCYELKDIRNKEFDILYVPGETRKIGTFSKQLHIE